MGFLRLRHTLPRPGLHNRNIIYTFAGDKPRPTSLERGRQTRAGRKAAGKGHGGAARPPATKRNIKRRDEMNARLAYLLTYSICYLLSLLPLWVLYRISDGLFYILYYVVRYRRPLVRKNLADSFPEKQAAEIVAIEKAFYAWFCDYIVEALKMFSISEKNISRRMKFVGSEMIAESMRQGKTCSLYLGHYCNWEWITSMPLHVKDGISSQIYHPLENKAVDLAFQKMRSRFGCVNIAMDNSFRKIVTWKRQGRPNTVGYIADQAPGLHNVHLWVDFLNHDTPVFTGAEKITMVTDSEVFYADMERPKRGYYVCTFRKMTLPPGGYENFYYTKEYFRLLEQSIRRAPQYWLWSHNRWKRTREQFNREYSEEERKRMLGRL